MLNESINEDTLQPNYETTGAHNRLEISRQVSNIENSSNQNSEMFIQPNYNHNNNAPGASHSNTPSRANQYSAMNKVRSTGVNAHAKTQHRQTVQQGSTKSIKRENTQKSLKSDILPVDCYYSRNKTFLCIN
jgi:hypothetical protein